MKLLGRSRRLNQAFTMVEETCKRFDLQANVHAKDAGEHKFLIQMLTANLSVTF